MTITEHVARRTYLVGYEVSEASGSQARLEKAISSSCGRWARPLMGLWFVETTDDIATLEGRLAPLVSEEDGLIIQEVTGRAGVHNTLIRWTSSFPRRDGFEGIRRSPSEIVPPFLRTGHLPVPKLSVVSSPL